MQVLKTVAAAFATAASLASVSADATPGETVDVTIFTNPSGMTACVDGADCFPVRAYNRTDRSLPFPRSWGAVCLPGRPQLMCLLVDTTESAPANSTLEDELTKTEKQGGQVARIPCIIRFSGLVC